MNLLNYMRVWGACVRYSVVRAMMFRFDFLMWTLVEFFWMGVNLLMVGVIYSHTDSIGGWGAYEMLMLVGTSMLLQRLLMGFFWSNLFEMGKTVRMGTFDFFLAQPGNPVFMISTRKLDLDSLVNGIVAVGLLVFAGNRLGLEWSFLQVFFYGVSVVCGVMICYGAVLMIVSMSFWIVGLQGIEGAYFSLFEFSRLPRQVFSGLGRIVFVWALPVVVVTNVPARILLRGPEWWEVLWLAAATVFWVGAGVAVFRLGLKRYTSASS